MFTETQFRSTPERRSAGLNGNVLTRLTLLSLIVHAVACGKQQGEAASPQEAPAAFNEVVAGQPASVQAPDGATPASIAVVDPALGESSPGSTPLIVYEIKMERQDLRKLEQSAFSNEPVPAAFTYDGKTYDAATIRYRGAWARGWPKKPVKIFFAKTNLFKEQRCLNLNSGWRDPAMVRECLAYYIYARSGAPAPRARMVRLNQNGQFRGVYVQVEQPDQTFVRRLNMKGASSYKAGSHSNRADERDLGSEAAYREHYEKQTKKSEGYAELVQFCRELNRTKDIPGFFNQHVDIEKYINYLAATALTQNWDGFNKNHYLIYDGEGSKKWFAVPWDLDRTLGDHWHGTFNEARLSPFLGIQQQPGVTGWNRMQNKFLSHPDFRKRFVDRLSELLETEFTTEKLFPVIDQLERQIARDASLDRRRWGGEDTNLQRGFAQLKRFIEQRRTYLLREVKTR